MTEQPARRWGEGVRISTPTMRTLSFTYDGSGEIPSGAAIDYEWGLEVFRFEPLMVGVEFYVGVKVADLEGHTSYRIMFELLEGSPEAESPDRAIRELAARVAPVTLFPYIREAFGSAAMRCGVQFTLPFQNVGTLFSPEEITMSDLPSTATESPTEA